MSCDTGLTGKYWHWGSSAGLHTEYLNVVHWCAAAPAEKKLRQFKLINLSEPFFVEYMII